MIKHFFWFEEIEAFDEDESSAKASDPEGMVVDEVNGVTTGAKVGRTAAKDVDKVVAEEVDGLEIGAKETWVKASVEETEVEATDAEE